ATMSSFPLNQWSHIAGAWKKGNYIKLYVNGELKDTEAVPNEFLNDSGSGFQSYFASYRGVSGFYNGKIDDFCIWNVERTISEIRENIHLPFTGSETGIVAYWQMNDGSGLTTTDIVNAHNGTLNNMTGDDWIVSTIPFGGGESNTQIVSATGIVDFAGTGLSMNFTSKTGTDTIVGTRIDTVPNIYPTGLKSQFNEQYWVVNQFGSGTFESNLTFTLSQDLTPDDESNPGSIAIYTRGSTADTSWTCLKLATSVNAANDEVTFEGITEFSQFIIGRKRPVIAFLALPFSFSLETQNFNSIDVWLNATPYFADIDGDGLLDLILGESPGNLNHYKQDSTNSTSFSLITNNFNSIDVGGQSAPTFTDLDGDNLLDLIIGEWDGNLNHWEQDSKNSTTFSLISESFNSIDVGNRSMPALTDLDGDGLLDLIVGEYDGYLNHYEQDNENSTFFSLLTENFNSIDVGERATPVFTDLDGDGLLDLIIGESDGYLNRWEQDSENSTSFTLITEYFHLIDVGLQSAPTFTDLDGDGLLDLIIGEQDGNLNHYEEEDVQSMVFGDLLIGNTGQRKYFLRCSNMTVDLSIECPDGFTVSLSEQSGFLQNLNITPLNGKISDTLYVRFEPASAMAYYGTISHISGGTSRNIDVGGTGIGSTDNFPGSALDFDGNDDYVSINHSDIGNPAGDFTIEVWARLNAIPAANADIISKHASGNRGYALEYSPSNGISAVIGNSSGWKIVIGPTWNVSEWHHLALTFDTTAQVMKLYDNGNLQGTETVPDPEFIDKDLYLAASQQYGNYFPGKIEEVRFWDIALDSIQIRENMHLTSTGYETGLKAYWQFNDGSGTILSNVVSGNIGTLHNMEEEDWVESTVATGRGVSDTQAEIAAIVDFTGTGLSAYYNAQNGASVTATRIDTVPNLHPVGPDTIFSNQYWVVNRFGSGTFNANLTFTIAEDLLTADQNNPSNISLYTRPSNADTNWIFLASASSVDAAGNQATFNGITGFSQFIIARETEIPEISIDLTVFLEGPFNGTDMNTDLNPADIPFSQPYNIAPWNYTGTETVAAIPNADVVDWVLVELRDTTEASLATSQTIIAQQAAFLLNDGSIVGLDGSTILSFNNSIIHSLFAVIWHRNSIGIMSAFPLIETGGTYKYDFTTSSGQVYGGGNAHKEIATGIWGMTGADGNADGQINNGDKIDVWSPQAGSGGYLSGDFNLDSQVNNGDKNDIWIPNTGSGGQVPDGIGYKCRVPE
ncbi:MAG: LamG domain-containing protein, partial [Bacteroidales bacterium]|nr:LamG domain-containing protein [Bacteroidales bacterium]